METMIPSKFTSAVNANPQVASRQMVRHLFRVSANSQLSQQHAQVPRTQRRLYSRAMAKIGYRTSQQLSLRERWLEKLLRQTQKQLLPWMARN